MFAARSVRRRIGRALLTVLAIALAAALLSSLLIAGGVARERVLNEIARGGPLTGIRVDAAAPDPGALDSDTPPQGAPKNIDDAAVSTIRELPGVRSVTPIVLHPVWIVAEAPVVRPGAVGVPAGVATRVPPIYRDAIVGVDLRRANDLPITLLAGRLPAVDSTDEVAVSIGYLRRLGLTSKQADAVVGTEIEYASPRVFRDPGADGSNVATLRGRWARAQVVGVVAQEAGNGEVLAPLAPVQAARQWTLSGGDPTRFGIAVSAYSALFVVADGLTAVTPVRQAITRVGYSTSAPESLIAQVERYVRVVEIVLGGIGTIALVIAALGITNALLAAVRERRREIGVLKAIGGRDRDVRRMFLIEAAMLGAVGGVVGAAAGLAIARTLARVVNRYLEQQGYGGVTVGIPALLIVLTVGGSALLALVAGTLPAQRASRLPARRAMGDR